MESVKVWFALPTDAAYALQHASEPCLAEEAIFTKATSDLFGVKQRWEFLGGGGWSIAGCFTDFSILEKHITRGSIGLSHFPSNSHHQDSYMFTRGFLYTFICNYCVEGGQPWQ